MHGVGGSGQYKRLSKVLLLLSLFVFLIINTTFLINNSMADDSSDVLSGGDTFQLIAAVRVPTNSGNAFRISYRYKFSDRESVYIRGLGTVHSQGQYQYLTQDSRIEVFDKVDGDLLHSEIIKDTMKLMGAKTIQLPTEDEFLPAYRQLKWTSEESFPEKTLEILNKYFPTGYRVYEADKMIYYLTSFTEVPGLQGRLSAKMAMLISHPISANVKNMDYRVQYIAQERRSHSDWRTQLSDRSSEAVDALIGNILRHLQEGHG